MREKSRYFPKDFIQEKENRGHSLQLIIFHLPSLGKLPSDVILMISPLTQKPYFCFFSVSPPLAPFLNRGYATEACKIGADLHPIPGDI